MSNKTTMADLLRTVFRELQKSIYTAIPGNVTGFDTSTQLAQLQIGIQRVDIENNKFDPAPLIECPVHFPGGDFMIEYEIKSGDEGLIVFSQRCIEGWLVSGGIGQNPILRIHDINDAFFIPGTRSQANTIANFQNDGIRMRDKAGTSFIWLKNDGTAQIDVSTLVINGALQVNSTIDATGDIESTGGDVIGTDGVFGGKSFLSHTHAQGNDSAGDTEVETNPPT